MTTRPQPALRSAPASAAETRRASATTVPSASRLGICRSSEGQVCWTLAVSELRYRRAEREDLTFLSTMLGEAAVWRPDKPTPTGEQVLADPRYSMYLAGWQRPGDYGLVAEHGGPVGAAWYRTYTESAHGYGFVAEDVPELSIAVVASRRGEGIGRRLLLDLIDASLAQGYRALCLSVAENNPARRLYESAGFGLVGQHEHTCTMVRPA